MKIIKEILDPTSKTYFFYILLLSINYETLSGTLEDLFVHSLVFFQRKIGA